MSISGLFNCCEYEDEKDYIENGPAITICEKLDFFCAKWYLNDQFRKTGYGIVVTPKSICDPIYVGPDENGKPQYQSVFQIANVIPDYQGGYIIEPIAEWEDCLEQMTIYNRKDIPFYEENFKEVYKALKNK